MIYMIYMIYMIKITYDIWIMIVANSFTLMMILLYELTKLHI